MNSNVFVSTLTALIALSFNFSSVAQNPPPTGTTQQQADATDADKGQDGIYKAQGSIHFRKDGKSTLVTHELKLSEGITARPNGEITLRDGRNITLQEGQLLTLDGKLRKAEGATGATANTQLTLPNKPELRDRGNEGDDLQQKAKARTQQ